MSICLAHTTALRYWRYVRQSGTTLPSSTSVGLPAQYAAADAFAARTWLQSRFALPAEPIHIAISNQAGRWSMEGVEVHCFAPATPSFVMRRIDASLQVLSPEATFAHLSGFLPEEALVLLGLELCGTYALDPSGGGMFEKAEPITTPEELGSFLDLVPRWKGVRRARKALRLVAAGSASPAESRLVVLLCSSRKNGGYGLPVPVLNRRVNVRRDARKMTSKRYFLCDLYWEDAQVDVEYDSDAFHAYAQKMAADAKRRNALVSMGVNVITVTSAQMADAAEFDDVAQAIAKALGIRLRSVNYDWFEVRRRLRQRLSDAQAHII